MKTKKFTKGKKLLTLVLSAFTLVLSVLMLVSVTAGVSAGGASSITAEAASTNKSIMLSTGGLSGPTKTSASTDFLRLIATSITVRIAENGRC